MNMIHKNGKREPVFKIGRPKLIIDDSVIPIWYDPNNYCRSCRKTYSDKSKYRTHIKKIHQDVLQEAMKLSASSSNPTHQINATNLDCY